MFEMIATRCVQPKEAEWIKPNAVNLKVNEDDSFVRYDLLKGAQDYLHKMVELKPSTSIEVFKKSDLIWRDLRDLQLHNAYDKPREVEQFSLTKPTVVYLVRDDETNGGNTADFSVVDMQDLKTEARVSEFEVAHEQFIVDLTTTTGSTNLLFGESKGGLVKFVIYDKNTDFENDEYIPSVIVEYNPNKSLYTAYTCLFIYKGFTFIPTVGAEICCNSLIDFILSFNLSALLDLAKERASETYESYKYFKNNPMEISVRELTSLFKKVGYKIELDSEDAIQPIANITDDESNQLIQNFYNTFRFTTGETALEILQLSEFRKTFRYNKITLLDALSIMSKEYLTYTGSKITAELLGDIVYKLYDAKSVDKIQVETIKHENQK